jgi:maltooligosyltrehalose trehalohydrolase
VDVPDPQDPATWRRSVLNWEEVGKDDHGALLDWYQRLIRLRQSEPALTDGRLDRVEAWHGADSLAMWRPPILAVYNLANVRRVIPLARAGVLLLGSEPEIAVTDEGVDLPPDSMAILRTE